MKIIFGDKLPFYLVAIIVLCWIANPQAWIADDSYFYLVIARNVAQFGSQTFSGIMPTNGVHPLWTWALSAWAILLNNISPDWLLIPQFAVILSSVCVAAAAFYYVKLISELNLPKESAVLPLLFTGFFGVLGSECHISLLTLSLLCWRAIKANQAPDFKNLFILGLVSSSAVLARLDNIFSVISILLLFPLFNYKHRIGILILPLIVPSFLLLLYFISNEIYFDGLMPVSGWMKSSFPVVSLQGFESGPNPMFEGVPIIWGWLPLIIVAFSVFFAEGNTRLLLTALLLGVFTKNIYIALFTRSHTGWYWYSTLDIFSLSLALPLLFSKANALNLFRRGMQCLAFLALVAICTKAVTWSLPKTHGTSRGLSLVMNNTSPGDTILVSDWPGYIAFFAADRHIFAADLLTSNRRWYNEMIKHGNALDFIRETCEKIGAPLTHLLWNGNRWLVISDDGRMVVYNDPRQYPKEREIGRWVLPFLPLEKLDKAEIWSLK